MTDKQKNPVSMGSMGRRVPVLDLDPSPQMGEPIAIPAKTAAVIMDSSPFRKGARVTRRSRQHGVFPL